MKLDEFITGLTQRKLWIQFSKNIKSGLDENTFLVAIKVPVIQKNKILTYRLEYLKGTIESSDNQTFLFLIDEGEEGRVKKYILNFFKLLEEYKQEERI